jgi:hypothetical protein
MEHRSGCLWCGKEPLYLEMRAPLREQGVQEGRVSVLPGLIDDTQSIENRGSRLGLSENAGKAAFHSLE